MIPDDEPLAVESLHIARPGYYETQLVKDGPRNVPVWIIERGERDPETGEPLEDIEILVEVAGRLVENEFRRDRAIIATNLFAKTIPEPRYHYLIDVYEWASLYAPNEPEASPYKPVDFHKMRPIY